MPISTFSPFAQELSLFPREIASCARIYRILQSGIFFFFLILIHFSRIFFLPSRFDIVLPAKRARATRETRTRKPAEGVRQSLINWVFRIDNDTSLSSRRGRSSNVYTYASRHL